MPSLHIPLNQHCGHFGSSFGQYILHSAGFRKTHPLFTILLATKWCQGWWLPPTLVPATGNGKVQTPRRHWLQVASGMSLRAAFQVSCTNWRNGLPPICCTPWVKGTGEYTIVATAFRLRVCFLVVTHPGHSKADSRASANTSW